METKLLKIAEIARQNPKEKSDVVIVI